MNKYNSNRPYIIPFKYTPDKSRIYIQYTLLKLSMSFKNIVKGMHLKVSNYLYM